MPTATTKNPTTTTTTKPTDPFIPFTDLLKTAWATLTSHLGSIVLLGLGNIGLVWLIMIIAVAIAAGALGVSGGFSDFNTPSAILSALSAQAPLLIALTAISFILIMTISLLFQAAMVKVIATPDKLGLRDALKSSLPAILPLFLVGIVTGLIVMGGMMVLLIPGIFFALLLMYATFEIILQGTNVTQSLKNSATIVRQNFAPILGRIALYVCILMLIMTGVGILTEIADRIDPILGALLGIIRTILNVIIGWFGLAYTLELYTHARQRANLKQSYSLGLMIVISLLGWLFVAFAVWGSINLLKGLDLNELMSQAIKTEQSQDDVSTIPTECGLAVHVPDTTDTLDSVERKWVYEEISQTPDSFRVLDQDVHPRDAVVLAALAYKDAQERIDEPGESIAYPGLNIYCTANPKRLTLEEYVALAVTSKDNTVTKVDHGNFGAVPTAHVTVEGANSAGDFTDKLFLAVSKDGNRLIVIRIWGAKEADPQAEQIKTDLDTIIENLNYRAVGPTLLVPDPITQPAAANTQSAAPASPSCTRMNIREGEFASNKCYSQDDYNDLAYYLQRFNSAAFSYNSAISGMNITCSGSEFFKDNCERHKAQKAKAEEDMSGYRTAINAIIARGAN